MRNLYCYSRQFFWVILALSITFSAAAITITTNVSHTSIGNNTGGVTITPVPATGVLNYYWSTGATTAGISGLGAGEYFCTVTQGSDTIVKYFDIGYYPTWDTLVKVNALSRGGIQSNSISSSFNGYAMSLNALRPSETGWCSFSIAQGDQFNGLWGLFSGVDLSSGGVPVLALGIIDDFIGVFPKGESPVSWGNYTRGNGYKFVAKFTLDSIFIDKYETDSAGTVVTSIALERTWAVTGYISCLPFEQTSKISETSCSFGCPVVKVNLNVVTGEKNDSVASIHAIVKGGVAPYTFLWSNGETSQSLNTAPLGEYSVTVTDDSSTVQISSAFVGSYVNWKTLTASQVDNQHVLRATGSTPSVGGPLAFYGMALGRNKVVFGDNASLEFKWQYGGNAKGFYGFLTHAEFDGTQFGYGMGVMQSETENPNAPQKDIYLLGKNYAYLGSAFDSLPMTLRMAFSADTMKVFKNDVLLYEEVVDSFPDLLAFAGLYEGAIVKSASTNARVGLYSEIEPDSCFTDSLGQHVFLKANVEGGRPPYQYRWSTGDTGVVIIGSIDSIYSLTVTSMLGDTVRDTVIYSVPAIFLTEDTVAICAGGLATLSAEPGYSYQWSTGDTTAVVSHVFENDSTVYVTVTNGAGCTAKDTVWVDVRALGTAAVTPDSQLVCYTDRGSITATGGSTYRWSTGQTSAAIMSPRYAGSDLTYTVTVTNSDSTQCSILKSVTRHASAQALITPLWQTVCAGDAATLHASGGTLYTWSNGATAATIAVSQPLKGDYEYEVWVTDSNGCSDGFIAYVYADSGMAASAMPDTAVAKYGASFEVTAAGGTQYRWSTGDTTAGIVRLMEGDTTYNVTVTNESNCRQVIEVYARPENTMPVVAPDTQYVVRGDTAILTAYGSESYIWSTGETTRQIRKRIWVDTTFSVMMVDEGGDTTTGTGTVMSQARVGGVNATMEIAIRTPDQETPPCSPREHGVEIYNNSATDSLPLRLTIACSNSTKITLNPASQADYTLTDSAGVYYILLSNKKIGAQQSDTLVYYQTADCSLIPANSTGATVNISNTVNYIPAATGYSYNISHEGSGADTNGTALHLVKRLRYMGLSGPANNVTYGASDTNVNVVNTHFKLESDSPVGGFYMKLYISSNCTARISYTDSVNNPMDTSIQVTAILSNGRRITLFKRWGAMNTDTVTFGLPADTALPAGTVIEVTERFKPVSCLGTQCNHELQLSLGCSRTSFCGNMTRIARYSQEQKIFNAAPLMYRAKPNAAYKNDNTCLNHSPWEKSCFGDREQWEYVVYIPSDTDVASNLEISIFRDLPLNQYTNIPLNSIEYDIDSGTIVKCSTSPWSFATDTIPAGFYSHGKPSCTNDTMVGKVTYKIPSLCRSCKLRIRFATVRCCPDNALPKDSIYTNNWKISGTYRASCSPDTLTINLQAHSGTLTGLNAMVYSMNNATPSTAFINPYHDFDKGNAGLKVLMEPIKWVNDLLGGFDDDSAVSCGDFYPIQVQNKTFLGYTQEVGDMNTDFFTSGMRINAATCERTGENARGIITIAFAGGPDLRVSDTMNLGSGNITLRSAVTMDSANAQYSADFDIADIAAALGIGSITSGELKQFMIESITSFGVMTCCPVANPQPTGHVIMYLSTDTGCGNGCRVPLGEYSKTISLRCPGCNTPGAIIKSASWVRHKDAYGYRDSDNNGLADADSNYLIRIDSAYIASHAVQTDRSIMGDRMEDRTRAIYQEGGNGGFTLQEWQAARAGTDTIHTNNLYLEYNYRLDSTQSYNQAIRISNPRIFYNNYATPATMQVLTADTVKDGYALLYIHADSLKAQLGLSAVNFVPGDKFEMIADIDMCGNTDSILYMQNVHRMFLSVAPAHGAIVNAAINPSKGYEVNSAMQLVLDAYSGAALADSLVLLNPRTAPMNKALFICEGRTAEHTRYPVKTFYNERWNDSASCNKSLVIEAGAYIGGNAVGRLNYFPYEYRAVNGFDMRSDTAFARGPQLQPVGIRPGLLHFSLSNKYGIQYSTTMESEVSYRDSSNHVAKALSLLGVGALGRADSGGFSHFWAAVGSGADYEPAYQGGFAQRKEAQVVAGKRAGAPSLLVGDEYFKQILRVEITPRCGEMQQIDSPHNVVFAAGDVYATVPEHSPDSTRCAPHVPFYAQVMDKAGTADTLHMPNPKVTIVPLLGKTTQQDTLYSEFRLYAAGMQLNNLYFYIDATHSNGLIPESSGEFVGVEQFYPDSSKWKMRPHLTGMKVYEVDGSLGVNSKTFRLVYRMKDCRLYKDSVYSITLKDTLRVFWSCTPIAVTDLNIGDITTLYDSLCMLPAVAGLDIRIEGINVKIPVAYTPPQGKGCADNTYTMCLQNKGKGGIAAMSAEFVLPGYIQLAWVDASCTSNGSGKQWNTVPVVATIIGDSIHYSVDARQLSSFDSIRPNGISNDGQFCFKLHLVPGCSVDTIPGFELRWDYGLFCGERLSDTIAGQYSSTVTTVLPNEVVDTSKCVPLAFALSAGSIACSGSISLVHSSGQAPYTYMWSDSATTQNRSGLGGGTYHVTVTDANGCTKKDSISVGGGSIVTGAIAASQDTVCAGGTVTLVASGGATYAWAGGLGSNDTVMVTPTATTTYTVLVRDSAGVCADTVSKVVAVANTLAAKPHPMVKCFPNTSYGVSKSSITVTATDAQNPLATFTYQWSNGATGPGIDSIPYGNYSVTVTTSNGCKDTLLVPIQPLSASFANVNPTCTYPDSGIIEVTVTGGNPNPWDTSFYAVLDSPYPPDTILYLLEDYHINGPGLPSFPQRAANVMEFKGLTAGVYSVIISDEYCSTVVVNTALDTPGINVAGSVVYTGCYPAISAAIYVSITKGTPPYTYRWTNNGTAYSATTQDISGLAAGTYQLVVSDSALCRDTLVFTIGSMDSLHLVSSSVGNSCSGGSGSISLNITGGVPPYRYIWGIGDTSFISSKDSLATGSYTVTVKDASNCTLTRTYSIGSLVTAAINNPPPLATCSGDSVLSTTLSTTTTAGIPTYLWSTGATTSSITAYAVGRYYVVVTDTNGCSASDTVYVTGDTMCCQGSFIGSSHKTYTFNNSSSGISAGDKTLHQISSAYPGIWSSGLTIALNGTFFVGGTVNVSNNTVLLMGDSSVLLLDVVDTFNVHKATIKACNRMWNGIISFEVLSRINIDSSRIEDAIEAIRVYYNPSLRLIANTFNNNRIGVFINGTHSNYSPLIDNNKFISSSLKAPFLGKQTHIGIFIGLVDNVQIPDTNGAGNLFEHLNNGITVFGSNDVVLNNNQFKQIKAYEPSAVGKTAIGPGFNHGVAVYGVNFLSGNVYESVTVNGGDTSKLRFLDCSYGIVLQNCGGLITKNSMQDVTNGVWIFNGRNRQIQILGNKMVNPKQGITAVNNPSSTFEIYRNYIDVTGISVGRFPNSYSNTYGIHVSDISPGALSASLIVNNKILHGRNGIYLLNTGKAQVQNNEIDLAHNSTLYGGTQSGIMVENCMETFVWGNHISGIGPDFGPNKYQVGIRMRNSTKHRMFCNMAQNIGYGIQFSGNCETGNKGILENIVGDNKYGWHFEKLSQDAGYVGKDIGSNSFITKNIFDGTFNNAGGFKTYIQGFSLGSSTYKKPPIYYYNTTQLYYPDLNASNYPAGELDLQPTTLATISNRCSDTIYDSGLVGPNQDDDYQHKVARDSIIYDENAAVMHWIEASRLFRKLQDYDSLRMDPIYDTFYVRQSAQDIGKVRTYELELENMMFSRIVKDSDLIDHALISLNAIIDSLPDGDNYTYNRKKVAQIYSRFIRGGTAAIMEASTADADTAFLSWLSFSCPYVEGEAVYEARSIYSMFNSEWFTDDADYCGEIGSFKTNKDATYPAEFEKKLTENMFYLYPNPSSSSLNFSYSFKKDEFGEVEIVNLLGQLVKRIKLPSNGKLLSIPDIQLQQGYYICKATTNMGYCKSIALIITK